LSRHGSLTNTTAPLSGRPFRFGIVVSDYNQDITGGLLSECVASLKVHGVLPANIRVIHVPGAFELPLAAQKLAARQKLHAVIALGCVLKGDTSHNYFISQETARGLGQVALSTGIPIIFGVLTPNNLKQARARSQKGPLNKGREAALTAISLAQTFLREKI
jgi:6,7-dimethyl-8-ribityllumazine synthase